MAQRSGTTRLTLWRERALALQRSHRVRKTLLILAIVLVLVGVFGFFAAPGIIKKQIETRASAALQRPVTLGDVHFNPYTLRLQLDKLHIGEAGDKAPFVDVDQAVVRASWTSLFRLAPVLGELSLQHPQVHLVRTADQRFNFSDIIDRFSGGPVDPNAKPTHFALANISVHNGDIRFDDQVLKTSHTIDQLDIGIPFLANFPSKLDVFVQPLLAMRVDGSPLHMDGQTKVFADSHESVMTFQMDKLSLPRYLAYAPASVPVAIPDGELSGKLEIHFVSKPDNNELHLDGGVALDHFALTNRNGDKLLELGHATAELTDVQPLLSRYHLGAVALDKAVLHYHRDAAGHGNFDPLTASSPAPVTDKPASKSAAPATDVKIDNLTLIDSLFDYADASGGGAQPATLELEALHGSVRGLSTLAAPPASVDVTTTLGSGSLVTRGALDLAKATYDGNFSGKDMQLAPLQPLALAALHGKITGGTLDGDGKLLAEWGKAVNVHLEPATFALNTLAIARDKGGTPVAWKSLQVKLAKLDLATSEARVEAVTMDGMQLDVQRLKNGDIDLASLLATPPAHGKAKASPASPAWHWSVAQIDLTDSNVTFKDLAADKPQPLTIHASHYSVSGVSDDMKQPLKLALAGQLGKGDYQVDGSIRPAPLDANLKVKASGVDIAPLEGLLQVPLNVRLGSALLSLDGELKYLDRGKQPAHIDYRGQATLGQVKVQDKVTNDDFVRWHSLALTRLQAHMGDGAPKIDIGGIALSDFYARVIINANGRLNVQDVVANPASAPVSVTRAEQTGAAPTPAPAATAPTVASNIAPASTSSSSAPPADIHIGGITLVRGQLNYTDNFIKPNYTANITDLTGKVGAFGTAAGNPPADLIVQGKLDRDSPVDINGSINPLAPVAFLDIKAKATGVQLNHLSPYSGKYAGYPITSGQLNADVHYQLDNRKLAADNHFFITQLSFGDRIDAPGVSHLPVKLAVALLKDSDGNIDLDLPVSGSLDDPQFSMGGVVWHALVNLLTRAVTSPFRLLASIGGGDHPDLGYVEFEPGSAVIDPAAQAKLEQLVSFMQSKPSLTLDITGRIDPAVDESGLRKVMVEDLVRQAKADDDGKHEDPITLQLTPDEYSKYLEKVYKKADFPKPKNAIGLTKSQPQDEMEQLLETNMPVNADALKALAQRRADAAHAWLKGKLDESRMTVQPPKLDATGIDDKGKTSRVDFGLH